MAFNVAGLNFVTSPSGLLVPEVTDNPGLGNGAADVTFDIAPSTADGWVLTTDGGEVVWAPPGGGNGGGGVDSIEADGGGPLTGDVTFSEGANITLTTAGNDIEIAASGGGGVTLLNYTQFTSTVTISSTTESGANTVVTASAGLTVDGSTLICVEFYSPGVACGSSNNSFVIVDLFQDSGGGAAAIGRLGVVQSGSANSDAASMFARRYLTPSSGTYTWSVRAWRGTSDGEVRAGAGGTAAYFPGYIRITSGT